MVPELPPQITTLEDYMAWAAYVSYQSTDPVLDWPVITYDDFKTERIRWDAVALAVVEAGGEHIDKIKKKAARYDAATDPHTIVLVRRRL